MTKRPHLLITVSCPVDPVVAKVACDGCDDPGPDGVPRQGVDAVVLVDVDVGRRHHTLQQKSEIFY